MTKRSVKFISVAAVLTAALAARADHGGRGGGGGPGGGPPSGEMQQKAAMVLARVADADRSGDVTATEWNAFVASLNPDAAGVISVDALIAALPLPPDKDGSGDHAAEFAALVTNVFDQDGDGKIETSDLNALFALLDTDGDGALSATELGVPADDDGGGSGEAPDPRKAALLLARAADADKSGDVSASEWSAFVASLNPDVNGVVTVEALVAALSLAPHAEDADDDPAEFTGFVTHVFDRNGDGAIGTDDLAALFSSLDVDGDGALSATELAPAWGGGEHDTHSQAEDAKRLATLLARAADADKSGDVTAAEWSAFIASLSPDANNVVDVMAIVAALPTPSHKDSHDPAQFEQRLTGALDQNGDGQVTVDDLNTLFALLDANGDGALSSSELLPPRPLHDMHVSAFGLLARAADADGNHDVTADEVTAFLGGLVADPATGAVDLGDLASRLSLPGDVTSDTTRRDALLVKLFDVDHDGVVTLSDLHTILSALDINGDGTIQKKELRRARRHKR